MMLGVCPVLCLCIKRAWDLETVVMKGYHGAGCGASFRLGPVSPDSDIQASRFSFQITCLVQRRRAQAWAPTAWVQTPSLPLVSCVPLNQLSNLCVPWFLHLEKGKTK